MPDQLKSKDPTQTTLFLLIETAQLARQKLLQSLAHLDLSAGDDAILLALSAHSNLADAELEEQTGLPPANLHSRQKRLIRLNLITRTDPRLAGDAGSKLTEKGKQVRKQIVQHWADLDEVLLADLKPKQKKHLKKALNQFSQVLLF